MALYHCKMGGCGIIAALQQRVGALPVGWQAAIENYVSVAVFFSKREHRLAAVYIPDNSSSREIFKNTHSVLL